MFSDLTCWGNATTNGQLPHEESAKTQESQPNRHQPRNTGVNSSLFIQNLQLHMNQSDLSQVKESAGKKWTLSAV